MTCGFGAEPKDTALSCQRRPREVPRGVPSAPAVHHSALADLLLCATGMRHLRGKSEAGAVTLKGLAVRGSGMTDTQDVIERTVMGREPRGVEVRAEPALPPREPLTPVRGEVPPPGTGVSLPGQVSPSRRTSERTGWRRLRGWSPGSSRRARERPVDGVLVPGGESFSVPPAGRDGRAQVALRSAGQEPCSAHQRPDPAPSNPKLKTLGGPPVLSPRSG